MLLFLVLFNKEYSFYIQIILQQSTCCYLVIETNILTYFLNSFQEKNIPNNPLCVVISDGAV